MSGSCFSCLSAWAGGRSIDKKVRDRCQVDHRHTGPEVSAVPGFAGMLPRVSEGRC